MQLQAEPRPSRVLHDLKMHLCSPRTEDVSSNLLDLEATLPEDPVTRRVNRNQPIRHCQSEAEDTVNPDFENNQAVRQSQRGRKEVTQPLVIGQPPTIKMFTIVAYLAMSKANSGP